MIFFPPDAKNNQLLVVNHMYNCLIFFPPDAKNNQLLVVNHRYNCLIFFSSDAQHELKSYYDTNTIPVALNDVSSPSFFLFLSHPTTYPRPLIPNYYAPITNTLWLLMCYNSSSIPVADQQSILAQTLHSSPHPRSCSPKP